MKNKNKNSQIVVAVIDTGVDSDHEFFKGRLLKNGYNAYDENTNWEDDNGHGTHVSGIIVDNSPSNVKILPIKVLGKNGSGSGLGVKLGIEKAVKLGADVINMSLGASCDHNDCPIDTAVLAAIKKGVTVVAAAGNETDNTADYCPAGISKCITVASVSKDGSSVSSFSNYGKEVDIAAPGENILSAEMGGGYVEMSGTSMAAPFVAAAAAMVLTNEPSLTPAQVEKKLCSYTTDIVKSGKDISCGNGVLNFGVSVVYYVSPSVSGGSESTVDRSYTVTIDDPSVLSYDGCVLTPKKVGSTYITFTLKNKKSAKVKVNIKDSGTWLNVAAKSYAGGKGTKEDPYLISTPEQLAKFSRDSLVKETRFSYKLTKDIDLSGRKWVTADYYLHDGIFHVSDYDEVVFDGNNHKIKNMTVYYEKQNDSILNSTASSLMIDIQIGTGFIKEVNNATIKNLGIENAYSDNRDGGLLCACVYQNTTIKNCYTSGLTYGCGLFGNVYNYNTKISNCYSSADVFSNGITNCFYSSKLGKNVMNNVFFCGRQLESQFSDESESGFINTITSFDDSANSTVVNCFNAGESYASVGFSNYAEKSIVSKCYYLNSNKTGIKSQKKMKNSNLSAKSLSFFKNAKTYTTSSNWDSKYNWDFKNTWAIDANVNNGFPYLKKNKPTKTTEEKTNTWLDYAATSYASGDGSKNNPYLISTASQLALVSKQYRYGGGRNVYFQLAKDIDLSAHNWLPIGSGKDINSVFIDNFSANKFADEAITKYRFFGNIDGNGKTISGMKIVSSGDFIGFIAINEDNVIKNLKFKNVSISARKSCGVVAGYNRLNSKIINCSVNGTVEANTTEPLGAMCGKNYAGGKIVGCSAPFVLCNENQGTISRCYNPKGLFNNSYGIVSDCYTQGKINSRVIYHSYCEYEKNGKTVATVYDEVYGNINKSKEVSSALLTDKKTFSSWDFSKIWTIDSKKNGGKPYVLNQKNYQYDILPTAKWSTVATTKFAGGNGTKNNPYLIATANQLAGVKKYLLQSSKDMNYFRLIKDIDLSGRLWDSAYSNGAYNVQLNFDGNGKTISNMTTLNGGGLFDVFLEEDSVIKNLNMKSFHGTTCCAVVVGNYGTISNCNIECDTLSSVSYLHETIPLESDCGAICETNLGTIEKCEVDIFATTNRYAGPFAGYSNGKIKNCSAKGLILGEDGDAFVTGVHSGVSYSYSLVTIATKVDYFSYYRSQRTVHEAADLTGEKLFDDCTYEYSSDLKKQSTFASWNFNSVWNINSKQNDGYPFIRKPTQRKITYVLNGGKKTANLQTDYIPGNIVTPQTPTKSGYSFEGWYKDSAFKNKVTTFGKSDEGNVTLYAKWTANTYSVKFYSNGGSGSMKTQTFTYGKSKALSKCTFTAPKGKVFVGWAKSKNGEAVYTNAQKVKNLTSKNKATVKLYAVWVTPKTYKIKYVTNGGTLSKNAVTTYKSGTGASLSTPTKKGYTFAGWYTDSSYKNKITKISASNEKDVTLYAKWTANTYSVKFYSNGGSGSMKTQTGFTYGKAKALSKCTFTAPKGKVFAGWAKSKDGEAVYTNAQKVKNLTSQNKATVKLYAVWVTPKTYKIKYETNGGTLSKNAATTYKSGTGASLLTPTKKGYTFGGWYTDKNFKSEKISTIKPWQTGNLKLYAKWQKK